MRVLIFLALMLVPLPALGGDQPKMPAGLAPLGAGRVAAVSDGDTLTLADGRVVRLVGIMAPKRPLDREDVTAWFPWPWAEASREGLEALALGREVRLWAAETDSDRHGRVLAHLERAEDGLWLQGAMLLGGLARVYSFADNRAATSHMYRLEARARAAEAGLWSHPRYRIVPAEGAERAVRDFALIEGRVRKVADVRGRIYLNFGEDWRRDFTIKAARRARRIFEAEGFDLTAYGGTLLRVRGWVRWENGPLIEVTHPEQIEVLERAAPARPTEADSP